MAAACCFLAIPLAPAGASPHMSTVKDNFGTANEGAVALSGKLRNSGSASSGEFQLVIWPSQQSLSSLTKGAKVPTKTVVHGDIAADGSFQARLNARALNTQYVSTTGTVDVELLVTDGAKEASWFTTLAKNGDGWTTLARQLERGNKYPEYVTLDLAAKTVVTSTQIEEHAARKRERVDPGSPVSLASTIDPTSAPQTLPTSPKSKKRWSHRAKSTVGIAAAPAEICMTWVVGDVNNLPEIFARVYAWSGARGKVDFDSGTSHTLGVARASGGAWSAAGSATISYGAGATVGGIVDANVLNRVNYRDYAGSCTPYTTRKPISIAAPMPSGEFTRTPHVNYTARCNQYNGGTSTWKTTSTNATIVGGVDIGPINVNAQSGWSSSTKMTYEVTSPSWLCGSTSAGWAASPGSSSRAA